MAEGRVLADRYRLVQALGRGGFSEVWRGEDLMLRRAIAVKLLTGATNQPERVRRMRREAQALARLAHPNVVAVFDAGLDGSDAFVVMELLAGPSLAGLLAGRGTLPVELALRYTAQAAAGLAAAHAVGVVHRDVKPGNLVLSAGGEVKVVDFGIATVDSLTLTGTSSIVGTPAYLSPEQAAGRQADQRSDVYSLGCVLFALLTGEPPFTAEHPVAVAHQHVTEQAPSARARRPEIPAQIDLLLAAMLAKDPAGRPQDAGIVRDRLAAAEPGPGSTGYAPATGHAPAGAGAPGSWQPTLQLRAPVTDPASDHGSGRPVTARHRGARPVLVLGGLIAAAAAVLLLHALAPSSGSPSAQSRQQAPARTGTAGSPAAATPSTPPGTPASAAAAAQTALLQAENFGYVQATAARELSNHLSDISAAIAQGDLPGASHQTADLLLQLDQLSNDGQVAPAGLAVIQPPLLRLAQLLPAREDRGNDQQNGGGQ